MTSNEVFGYILLLVALGGLLYILFFRRKLVMETERGVLYRNGKYVRTLAPGAYWIFRPVDTLQG